VEALNYIYVGMAAIVFGWLGYFIGNFLPVFGKAKKNQIQRKAEGRKLIDVEKIREKSESSSKKSRPSVISRTFKKASNWLLEREPEEELLIVSPFVEPEPEVPLVETASVDQPQFFIPDSLPIPDDAVVLWHDRKKKKIYSRVGKDIFDLESDLTKQQHASLSMLLVDLQFKIGLSATLKAALSESTDQASSDRERKSKIASMAAEESGPQQTFNPVKSFLNYVKADVPKLEDKPETIPNQINAFLQDLIKDSPLREHGISVSDWPNRGVVFIVGLEIHDNIDEIQNEEIRTVIKQAVAEWERTQLEE